MQEKRVQKKEEGRLPASLYAVVNLSDFSVPDRRDNKNFGSPRHRIRRNKLRDTRAPVRGICRAIVIHEFSKSLAQVSLVELNFLEQVMHSINDPYNLDVPSLRYFNRKILIKIRATDQTLLLCFRFVPRCSAGTQKLRAPAFLIRPKYHCGSIITTEIVGIRLRFRVP